MLNEYLVSLGFTRGITDACIYVKDTESSRIYLLVYVDDVLIASSNLADILSTKQDLLNEFTMTDLGPLNHFLGFRIKWEIGRIILNQTKYVENVLEKFGMTNERPLKTPLHDKRRLSKEMSPVTDEEKAAVANLPYRQVVGSIMYAMTGTRPDLAYAVGVLSRYNASYGLEHWEAALKTLRYMKYTMETSLVFEHESKWELTAYVDADYATDPDTRRSTSGHIICLGTSPVSWRSKRQQTVATSTAESEYIAATEAIKELLWIRKLLLDFKIEVPEPMTVHEDNMACIHMSKDEGTKSRTKHVEVRYHFTRQMVREGKVKLVHCKTQHQKADMLTKELPGPRLAEARRKGEFIKNS